MRLAGGAPHEPAFPIVGPHTIRRAGLAGAPILTLTGAFPCQVMGWDDLNWLEDVHMGYEEGAPAVFDRNINGWVRVPASIELADNQQDRDMQAREFLLKFQMSDRHPLGTLRKAYAKF